MQSQMQPRRNLDCAMAVSRLRQYTYMRAAMRSARTSNLDPDAKPGRPAKNRNTSHQHARLVWLIDFDSALESLTAEQIAILLYTYRDGFAQGRVAQMLGISARAISYKLTEALRALANKLDRMDML